MYAGAPPSGSPPCPEAKGYAHQTSTSNLLVCRTALHIPWVPSISNEETFRSEKQKRHVRHCAYQGRNRCDVRMQGGSTCRSEAHSS